MDDAVEPAVAAIDVVDQRSEGRAVAHVDRVVDDLRSRAPDRRQCPADLAVGHGPRRLRLDRRRTVELAAGRQDPPDGRKIGRSGQLFVLDALGKRRATDELEAAPEAARERLRDLRGDAARAPGDEHDGILVERESGPVAVCAVLGAHRPQDVAMTVRVPDLAQAVAGEELGEQVAGELGWIVPAEMDGADVAIGPFLGERLQEASQAASARGFAVRPLRKRLADRGGDDDGLGAGEKRVARPPEDGLDVRRRLPVRAER